MRVATPSVLRKFGLVVGGVLLLLGGWEWWRGSPLTAEVLGGSGGLLMVTGWLAPKLLAPLERAWMAMAEVLGRINTVIILTVLYFVLLAPIGYVRRRFSDPLDRKLGEDKASHWRRRDQQAFDPARYRQQF